MNHVIVSYFCKAYGFVVLIIDEKFFNKEFEVYKGSAPSVYKPFYVKLKE